MTTTTAIRQARTNWKAIIFTSIIHLIVLIGLPLYFLQGHVPSLALVLASVFFLYVGLLSITVLYHRYYSHRSYTLRSKIAEFFLLLSSCFAIEGTALRWAHDHRQHHRYVDSEKDPYRVKDGFWHAHMWWYFKDPEPQYKKYVPDLLENKLVMFFDKYYGTITIAIHLVVFLLLGFVFADFFGALVFFVGLRLFLTHHLTGFINSWAHWWGDKPYSIEHTAVNSYLLCFLTCGEGYHNYHHTFGSDYRNGIKWYHFDPTKWIIWSMAKIGIATGLKKISNDIIRSTMLKTERKQLLSLIKKKSPSRLVHWQHKIDSLHETILEFHAKIRTLRRQTKKQDLPQTKREEIIAGLQNYLLQLKQRQHEWFVLCKQISSSV